MHISGLIASLALLACSAARVLPQNTTTSSTDVAHSPQSTAPGSFWYEEVVHNGISPFISNGDSWKVYRNVKDYGATGDGTTDDSGAIQAAINDGNRGAGGNGMGTTGAPAVVYFPSGTYSMASSIQIYVDTVLMGNPIARPTLLAASDISTSALVYGKDPGLDATVNFYSAVKNLVLDSTPVDSGTDFLLLDWSVSQATQLTNVLFNMPSGSSHTGVSTPEGGSGTFMGNLDFVGGSVGINFNNQQYNVKSATFSGCSTGILISHAFDLVLQDIAFSNCNVGIDGTAGGTGNVGSYALIDSTADSVNTLIRTKSQGNSGDDSVVIDNLQVSNVGATVVAGGNTILTGGVDTTWVYGDVYTASGSGHQGGTRYATSRSAAVAPGGKFFTMAPPTYQTFANSSVVNVKSVSGSPVYGDGQTDDTASINAILASNTGKLIFFPAGTYIVTSTIKIPPGTRMVGEAWAAISASGSFFNDASNPQPMVQMGQAGETGTAQISDMVLTVADILPGCILLEVNMAGSSPGDVGLWNTHFRVGGAAGSQVETNCGDDSNPCTAAFLMLHIQPTASVYIEDMWGWTADHDLDGNNNQVISTGRGALVESTGGTWLVGTAFEHNTLYQYNFNAASNVYTGMQQSETPYWQGSGGPDTAPRPWTPNSAYHDPAFGSCNGDANCGMAWFQIVNGGSDVHMYGTGFWTFFDGNGGCSGTDGTCQDNAVTIEGSPERLFWFNHNTRGNLNLVIDEGAILATQNSNPGSWGGIVAGILTHSGL